VVRFARSTPGLRCRPFLHLIIARLRGGTAERSLLSGVTENNGAAPGQEIRKAAET
jgi:hypothetical protein